MPVLTSKKNKILALARRGYSTREIARRVDTGREYVRKIVRDSGMRCETETTKVTKILALARRKRTMSHKEIAARLNTTIQYVSQVCVAAGMRRQAPKNQPAPKMPANYPGRGGRLRAKVLAAIAKRSKRYWNA
jgi:transcriptional regulator